MGDCGTVAVVLPPCPVCHHHETSKQCRRPFLHSAPHPGPGLGTARDSYLLPLSAAQQRGHSGTGHLHGRKALSSTSGEVAERLGTAHQHTAVTCLPSHGKA
jgi:hypothetical protein